MPKRQASSSQSAEYPKKYVRRGSPMQVDSGKYSRRGSPMDVDEKSASLARGVPERTSHPYASKPKSKSPTYHTAKSHSRTYFSIPVSRPPPPPPAASAKPSKAPSAPRPTASRPTASRPPAPRPTASRPPAPRPPPQVPFPQLLRSYYHAQFLKLKQQFGVQPFQLTLRTLVPFHPDKVYANTSLHIAKHASLNTIVNTFYKELEDKRNTTVTVEILWMIYRTHAMKMV